MNVTVVLNGSLSRYAGAGTPGEWRGTVPEGTRLLDLIRLLGIPEGVVAMATINGDLKRLDTVVTAGARVLLLTPMSGG